MSSLLTRMKGQAGLSIGSIPAIVLTLVLVGFYLSFGALIVNDLGDTTYNAASAQENNESLGTELVNISSTVQKTGVRSPSNYQVVQVLNATDAVVPNNANNFTFVNNGDGTATFTLKSMQYNNTVLRITYTYDYEVGTAATNATINTEAALNTFSSRLPLLALVLFFAIILSVIAILAATGRIAV